MTMAADPPGEASDCDDSFLGIEGDRPLVFSNPSSYASSGRSHHDHDNSSAASSSLRTMTLQGQYPQARPHSQHQQQQQQQQHQTMAAVDAGAPWRRATDSSDDLPHPNRNHRNTNTYDSSYNSGEDDDDGGGDDAPLRRTLTGYASHFAAHHRSDPVQSVAGGYMHSSNESLYARSVARPPRSVVAGAVADDDDGGGKRGRRGSSAATAGESSSVSTSNRSMTRDVRRSITRGAGGECAVGEGGTGGGPLRLTDGRAEKWDRRDSCSYVLDECGDTDCLGGDYRGSGDDEDAEEEDDDFEGSDGYNGEEHYRRRLGTEQEQEQQQQQQQQQQQREHRIVPVSRGRGLEPDSEVPRVENRIVPRGPDREPERKERSSKERQIVPAAQRRNLEPEEQNGQIVPVRSRSSERKRTPAKEADIVADIRNELALVDPSASKYSGFQHCFITIREEHRFLMLYTFLKRNVGEKVLVFFSTTKSTQFYARLLRRLKFDARAIHNGMSKERFISEFLEFGHADAGILCVPDFQGNDLTVPPSCGWIVQFEPCSDPAEYIFRVGRISAEDDGRRGRGGSGGGRGGGNGPPAPSVHRALLFLTAGQFGFLKYYRAAKVKVYEYEIPRISNVQRELVKMMKKEERLKKLGTEAYHAFLLAYASHDYRDVYNVHDLDERKLAMCFGFDRPPSKKAEEEEKGSSFQEAMKSREENRWRAIKVERKSWMQGEKSWRYSDIHADKMKAQPQSRKERR